jgi:flagellar biosynthesis/type III secretory pathway protein FliH
MTSRPHDSLFKWAFESPSDAAALLRELLPPPVRDAIAWETLGDASGSFVDVTLGEGHSDLLFAARLRTRERALAYLLIEHQSTDDPDMPLRMLSYQTQLWGRLRKAQREQKAPPGAPLAPILGVLVGHPPGGWTSARSFEQLLDPEVMAIPELAAMVPRFSMVVDDLARRSDADLRARALAPFQKLALWLLRDARDPERLLNGFDAWIPTILQAGQTRSGRDSINVLVRYLFHTLDPVYFDIVRAKLEQLGTRSREIAMTIAEYLEEQGRKKGREEGLQEGRQEGLQEGLREGRLATLRSLLLYKFGALDAASEARLQAAAPEALDRYLRRVLAADSLAAVLADGP